MLRVVQIAEEPVHELEYLDAAPGGGTQLRRLPFTELKLDRTFVSGATSDADARSLLESSVQLAKRLRLKTVAEGIETEEEWNLLVWMGVDLGQGYYMARPMPGDKIAPWYSGWQSKVA